MARKSKFEDIELIMDSAAMSESDKVEFSHAKKNDANMVVEVKISKISDNPYQPRLEMKNEELLELANSIQINGLLQPVALNKVGKDSYELVAGHRRVAAHKLLKEKTIKSIIVSEINKNDSDYGSKMAVNALIENLQRSDLDVLETAISLQNLLNEKIFKTKNDLAKATGKTNAYISKVLSVLRLDNEIINDLKLNKSIKDIEALYELQKITDIEIQLSLYKELIKGNLTRNEIREYNKKRKISINQKKITSVPYELKVGSKKLNLSTNNECLNKEEIINFELELKSLLKKYFK